jgi:hypothetical protein
MAWMQHPTGRRRHIFLAALSIAASLALAGCLSLHTSRAVATPNTGWPAIPGDGIAVYAAGDIADCRRVPPDASGAAVTARMVETGLAAAPDAVAITLGDHTYPIGLYEEFTFCYQPTWGRFRDRTHPAPGNHEYNSPGAAGYYRYFGAAAGPERRGYYSFMLGGWHVVSINSNLQPSAHQRQLDWLKNTLAQTPAKCTLAYWHHPLFSSGGHGNQPRMRDVWKILEAAGADVVLAAHDHNYERFAPQTSDGRRDEQRGIRQFVVGTGGARLTPILFRKANSEAVENSTHGVLRLVLKESGYEWEFLAAAGGFSDRGATLCH